MNYLDWITELDTRFKVRQIVQEHFVAIAYSQNALTQNIKELADREVDGSRQCTLFSCSFVAHSLTAKIAHTTLL